MATNGLPTLRLKYLSAPRLSCRRVLNIGSSPLKNVRGTQITVLLLAPKFFRAQGQGHSNQRSFFLLEIDAIEKVDLPIQNQWLYSTYFLVLKSGSFWLIWDQRGVSCYLKTLPFHYFINCG